MKAKSCFLIILTALLFAACSPIKHVPDGEYLLDRVTIDVAGDDTTVLQTNELYNFLRQQPNHKVLGMLRLQLATYSLSGRDSTKRINRWLQRLGQPPVIFDRDLTEQSRRQLQLAMVNRGFLSANVAVDTTVTGKKRMGVDFTITPGIPHRIGSFAIECKNAKVDSLVTAINDNTLIHTGALFDRGILDNERARITTALRNEGYYAFNRDCVHFVADTVAGSHDVGLTMIVEAPPAHNTTATLDPFTRYTVRNVTFITDPDQKSGVRDTVDYHDIDVIYGSDRYLRPQVLFEKCHIESGAPFDASAIDRTYESLAQLPIIKYINVEMQPVGGADSGLLDAVVTISRNKKQSVSVEVEGTNSEGDLGFGIGLTYQHRDIDRRGDVLTAKLRGSYESLSGNFEDLINNRYTEFAGEVALTFPRFEAPFLSRSFKQKVKANTEFGISFNHQERPEYTRLIMGAAWKYKWTRKYRGYDVRRTYDFIDINYVYLPRSTYDFINQIAPDNPLLRYSYEDHFIMRMGYTYYRTNRRTPGAVKNSFATQPSITTLRWSAEIAGNLLYAFSKMCGQHKSDDGTYKIFGIQYAQYAKSDFDFTHVRNFNNRNALAFRVGAGIEYPYGNSTMVPFEKRFYAGGANGVRGWNVRTLGPGAYDSRNDMVDFINQCGDISFITSLEYRLKLFWVFEGALFIDAGNIWTIKNYPTQPEGMFKFNKFYKQIAASYGAGIRMDFSYFLLRFDLGMKAHDPALGRQPWPLTHPNWHRDATFHFAVGYPF